MKRPTPPTRSLTEVPGWLPKTCERCERQFWSVPSQFKYTRFCTPTCRYESPEQVIEKTTTKGVGPKGECWNCALTPSADYPCIKIKGEQVRVNRFVLEKILGRPIAAGMQCLHSCDNSRCIREEHLSEGTQKENIRQAVERGRLDDRKGSKCPTVKLTEEQARDIKFNPLGLMGKDLALKHGVSKTQVSVIQNGKQWTELQP